MKSLLFPACLLILGQAAFPHNASAAAPEVAADQLPRTPATEPADALATFEVAPGFKLTLAAHEPAVVDPIAMCFDEKGRAYVVEMIGYSERREAAACRIRLLTDADGDGVFERSIVFKDGLKWPSAILCYKGGVFVGATPDLCYFKDTDGDGVCDEQRTVFTGFGGGNDLRLNMQALFNSLRWGPDNRVWGATAGNGGLVTRPDAPADKPVSLRGADFSFDPEKLDLRPENGTAQYGMSFDSLGRRFVCSNSRHLIWVAYERHQAKANPWYSLPAPFVDIPADGPAPTVYRISPDEPWRIVRTRWRVAGVEKGIVEGGGRVSGFFVAAAGIHLYWGDAFPAEFRDNAFIGDVGSNLIHRKVIASRDGKVQPVGVRPDPQEKTEFLRSRDTWFRPTSITSGPDGCLYVTDMYREVIEHPWSLPEPIKKHLDLNSGNDRGRIYRIAPAGYRAPKIGDLGAATDDELRGLTTHANDWHRTTARRLLYERGKPAAPMRAHAPFPAALAAESPLLDGLAKIAGDPWMEAAALNSLRSVADLASAWEAAKSSPGPFRAQLAGMIGRAGDQALLAEIGRDIAGRRPDATTVAMLTRLREGMGRARGDWRAFAADPRWDPLTDKAAAALTDASTPVAMRVESVRVLSLLASERSQPRFRSVLTSGAPDPTLAAALAAAITDLDFLIGRFAQFSSVREELAGRILADPRASRGFLTALRERRIALADAPASLIENLRRHADAEVKALAAQVLPPVVSRADVIAAYQPALAKKGDATKGKAVFARSCVACHVSHEGVGIKLGPALASFAAAGAETLLGNILDPNREIAPQYQAYTFEFAAGPPATGFIVTENPAEITLRQPGGVDRTFARAEVASMKGVGRSIMPEGLEAGISVEEMADLIAYLTKTP